MSKRDQWYCGRSLQDGLQVPVQVDNCLSERYGSQKLRTLPKELVEIAGREYERQGYGQTFERLCERGGLGILEILMLLADAYNRQKGEAGHG